jgi:hypothetical protein
MSNLPSIKKLYSADLAEIAKQDEFIVLMNQPPAPEWVKEHPYIKGHKYLPIERVEFLLNSIFKANKIEVTGQGQSFTGVWVTVRVHYIHPVFNEWMFHDGLGAEELQLRAATQEEKSTGQKVVFAVENINKGALKMAYPLAETEAIKDACHKFGKLFGANLNRKEEISYSVDLTLTPLDVNHPNWNKACDAVKGGKVTIEAIKKSYDVPEESETYLKTLVP